VGRNAVKASIALSDYSMGKSPIFANMPALHNAKMDEVTEYGRRFLDMQPSPKRQTRQCDFEALRSDHISETDADILLIALGTNRKNAGSAEVFKKVDQDYVRVSMLLLHVMSTSRSQILRSLISPKQLESQIRPRDWFTVLLGGRTQSHQVFTSRVKARRKTGSLN
jgi:hypothetical protein